MGSPSISNHHYGRDAMLRPRLRGEGWNRLRAGGGSRNRLSYAAGCAGVARGDHAEPTSGADRETSGRTRTAVPKRDVRTLQSARSDLADQPDELGVVVERDPIGIALGPVRHVRGHVLDALLELLDFRGFGHGAHGTPSMTARSARERPAARRALWRSSARFENTLRPSVRALSRSSRNGVTARPRTPRSAASARARSSAGS